MSARKNKNKAVKRAVRSAKKAKALDDLKDGIETILYGQPRSKGHAAKEVDATLNIGKKKKK